MKFIRFLDETKKFVYGWIYNDTVGLIKGDLFGEYMRLEPTIPLNRIDLGSPVLPSKIICVGRNYAEHAIERQVEIPEVPLLFLKPPSSIIATGDSIILPPQSDRIEHEAELAVIIGKRGKWIPLETTSEYVLGYTIANDLTARDIQQKDGQWTRGKGFDTFCPLGPWIETELDPTDLLIRCRVNGELKQMASTKDMIFSIPQIISYISNCMTLEPGDVILTGTPAGVSAINHGDEIEIEIEGIGSLTNPVRDFES